ncbi:MAG: PA0069 family radical SAM protein [Planctomycetes bacterium]|nr:PA0069 family radical SAM protein [Planctomycetota bacterium]
MGERPRILPPPPDPGRPEGIKGRGASANAANRFERLVHEPDPEFDRSEDGAPSTVLLRDDAKSIIARNDSPDLGFDASLNPYRGCEHGCSYCYARPTHEYAGMSAGIDFETRILVKEDAPRLLRAELMSPRWTPQVLAMSGVTDCYQPIERRLRLTRRCLEILAEFRNPVGIITKNQLVTRDLDLLVELARHDAVHVTLSVTSLSQDLAQRLEPRASVPAARLAAIRTLADAGIPVGVNIQPVIPGLTDHEVPAIVQAAYDAGARWCSYGLVRLPHAVAPLFERWLEEHAPEAKSRVIARIQAVRGGKLNDPRFGTRGTGEGVWAQQIADLFRLAWRRAGYPEEGHRLSTAAFVRPGVPVQQSWLVP